MQRRTLLAGAAALAAAPLAPRFAETLTTPARAQASGRATVVFWHAMTGANADEVARLAAAFNAQSQTAQVQPVFKGTYPELLSAAIAAWRADQAPHLAQVFEVGTASMLAAGPAVKPAWQLIEQTKAAIDPNAYIPAVRGYYSLSDGRLASVPFNSSTAVLWYNKDQFEKAGLDPEKPPATWPELVTMAQAIKAKNASPVAMTTSWPSWIQFEEYAAIHNVPFATKADGFDGLDAQLLVNKLPFVKHLQRLMDMAKDGTFRYAGRDSAPDPIFLAAQCAMQFNSSGNRGDISKDAKFRWAPAFLPYDPELIATPINSIIGGASLWTMTAKNRTEAEYKGAADFLAFLAQPENAAAWSQHTGYVPVTTAGSELTQKQGFYARNPGTDLPVRQLQRGHVTDNSRGIRLGRLPEIRVIIQEEMERALQGGQTAQAVLDTAVERGNKVLREFQRTART